MSDTIPTFKVGDRVVIMNTDDAKKKCVADRHGVITKLGTASMYGALNCIVSLDEPMMYLQSVALTTAHLNHERPLPPHVTGYDL